MPNTTIVTLGGMEYLLRASNYASQVYSEEFFGRDLGGYNGSLAHDTSKMLSDCIEVPEPVDEPDVDEPDVDEPDAGGVRVRFVTPALWGIVWALAYAAGSVDVGYERWMASARDEIWTVQEQADACVEVIDLVTRCFFR